MDPHVSTYDPSASLSNRNSPCVDRIITLRMSPINSHWSNHTISSEEDQLYNNEGAIIDWIAKSYTRAMKDEPGNIKADSLESPMVENHHDPVKCINNSPMSFASADKPSSSETNQFYNEGVIIDWMVESFIETYTENPKTPSRNSCISPLLRHERT